MAFTMRFSDDIDVEELDRLARNEHGIDRTHFINLLIKQTIAQGFVPRQVGEGYKATSSNGGVLSLVQNEGFVSGGNNNLTEEEAAAFEQARQFASSGLWDAAKHILQTAGFEITNVTG
jgi:alkyl sulfatase BDS1-like metallo-beta-lactamase superfamily hydrolase